MLKETQSKLSSLVIFLKSFSSNLLSLLEQTNCHKLRMNSMNHWLN
jgi:hypothetical protein